MMIQSSACNAEISVLLAGNDALINLGGLPLLWPTENIAELSFSLFIESTVLQQKQSEKPGTSEQPSLFAIPEE